MLVQKKEETNERWKETRSLICYNKDVRQLMLLKCLTLVAGAGLGKDNHQLGFDTLHDSPHGSPAIPSQVSGLQGQARSILWLLYVAYTREQSATG